MRLTAFFIPVALCGVLLTAACSTASTDRLDRANGSRDLSTDDRVARLEADMALIMQDLTAIRRAVESGTGVLSVEDLARRAKPDGAGPKPPRMLPKSRSNKELRVERERGVTQATGSVPPKPVVKSGWRDAVTLSTKGGASARGSLRKGSLVLHLGSFTSQDNAQAARIMVQSDYSKMLGGQDVYVQPSQTDGETFYRVLAGPVGSKEKAENRCRELQGKGAYCAVITLSAKPRFEDE